MSIFNRKKKFHFIGIGGIGMSGLADILIEMGHQVSGSDRMPSELTKYLSGRGARFFEGHDATHLVEADYVVYSSAVAATNPEMMEARNKNIPILRRADLLGQFMLRKLGIAVAGTHGKTTTTSMIGTILVDADWDPTIIVGGRMQNTMTNARLGNGNVMVTEADEFDRSFLTLYPRISVITSLETDHLDIYKDLTDLSETFIRFANQTSFDGSVIAYAADENLKHILPRLERTVVTYAANNSGNYSCGNIHFDGKRSEFTVSYGDEVLGEINLLLPGLHNVNNALAALAVCRELDIPFHQIKSGLEKFCGVERRFELKDEIGDVLFFDDYAHHPSEVHATIQAAKNGWNRRIVAIFQPHLFSRTRDFYREFAAELNNSDLVVLAEIYPAREEPIRGITSGIIQEELKALGHENILYFPKISKLADETARHIKPGDLVITMGAGDIWQCGEELIRKYKNLVSNE